LPRESDEDGGSAGRVTPRTRFVLLVGLSALLVLWFVGTKGVMPRPVRAVVTFGLAGVIMFIATSSPSFFRRFVGETTPGSLGAIRMLTCLVVLVNTLLEDLSSIALLPPETNVSHGLMRFVYALPIGFDRLLTSATGLWAFQLITELIVFLGVVGWHTRIVVPLGAACHFVLGGILRDYSFDWHQGWVPLYLMMVLSFTPCGDGWSVDRMRSVYRGRPVPDADRASAVYGWSRYVCWVVIAAPYVESGLAKLRFGGLSWFSASNMRNILYESTLMPREFDWQPALYLAALPDIVFSLLALVSVVGEASFGLVLFSRVARRILPIAMVMMHLGILALQKILFLDLMLLQLTFIDFREVRMRLAKRLAVSRGRIHVAYDETVPFWRRAIRVLACLDLFGRLDWAPAPEPRSVEPGGLRVIWRGRTYGGAAAYRIIARAIPLLWVFVPFLYVPGFYAVGRVAWRYASRRSRLATAPSASVPASGAGGSGVERSAHRWRFPLVVSGWVLVSMVVWTYRIEYYPLTSWHLFVIPNTSGRVTYNKVVARLESGEVVPMRLEEGIAAMRFDGRYAPFLSMCFRRGHRRPPNPRIHDIDMCRKFLIASGSAYNRKAPPGTKVIQLEIQAWEWDFGTHPLDPEYGRLVDRFAIDIGTERGS
jgi:hypothetical protein